MRSTCLAIVLIKAVVYQLLIGTKIGDLKRRSGPYFCVVLLNLVVSRARCVKVVDKAITDVDNLRLLCLVANVCRGTARHPRYKYSITAR